MNHFTELREWHASLPRPSWSELLLEFLLGLWKGARDHAERPERRLPYY